MLSTKFTKGSGSDKAMSNRSTASGTPKGREAPTGGIKSSNFVTTSRGAVAQTRDRSSGKYVK